MKKMYECSDCYYYDDKQFKCTFNFDTTEIEEELQPAALCDLYLLSPDNKEEEE